MTRIGRRACAVGFVVAVGLGCTITNDGRRTSTCIAGAESCPCADGSSCTADLVCLSNVCVDVTPDGGDTQQPNGDGTRPDAGDSDNGDGWGWGDSDGWDGRISVSGRLMVHPLSRESERHRRRA